MTKSSKKKSIEMQKGCTRSTSNAPFTIKPQSISILIKALKNIYSIETKKKIRFSVCHCICVNYFFCSLVYFMEMVNVKMPLSKSMFDRLK